MADLPTAEQPEKWEGVGEQFFTGVINVWIKSNVSKWIQGLISDVLGAIVGVAIAIVSPLGLAFTRAIGKAQDDLSPALSEIASAGVNQMFDTEIPASAFELGQHRGGHKTAADALAAGLLKQIVGTRETLTPGDEAATRYLGVMVKMALEGWYQGWFFEWITSLVPEINIGQIENYGSLDTKMSDALGLGRLSRRVLSPIIDASIVTPLEWHVNKKYRPNLLGASAVARQWARGRWDWADVVEELARQGYDDVRIDALINEQRKFLSAEESLVLKRAGAWDRGRALQNLREQGYDEDAASWALAAVEDRRLAAIDDDSLAALRRAYTERLISDAEFESFLVAVVPDNAERQATLVAAQTIRELNVRPLSIGEVEQAVKAKILNFIDYREALARAGYTDTDGTVKELLLRVEIEKETSIAEHRAQMDADRAAQKAKRDAAAAVKLEQVEAARALARRGDESDLENAAVRGIIPLSRVEEVYRARYDADVVGILLDVLEGRRQEHLAEQQRRKDAELRVTARGLTIGELDASVLEHVMTLDRYRVQLEALHVTPADIDVLARTLESKMRARDAAQVARDRALDAAAHVGIDLDRFEQLVRRGVRTLAQYAELLRSLNRTDAAVADMVELLKLKIADDAAAQAAKAAAGARVTASGLTLDELRRAVVLGLHTRADYASALLELKIAADKQILLLAELDQAVADAERARTRREAADAERGGPRLPLATLARAARLGVLTPAVYQAQLEALGFTDADVLAEHDLLTLEISQALTLSADDRAQQVASVEGALAGA